MTIFVKDVTDITIAGARESMVTKNKTIKESEVSLGVLASFTLKFKFVMGILELEVD